MGTNHLGHFALTCLLGDRIKDRVVSVISMKHRFSRIDLDDLNFHNRKYSKWSAYGESKLAVMLFIQELARRGVRAIAVDPGGATPKSPGRARGSWAGRRRGAVLRNFPQSARDRGTVQHPGGDDGPAQRDISGPAFQAVGQAEGDQDG